MNVYLKLVLYNIPSGILGKDGGYRINRFTSSEVLHLQSRCGPQKTPPPLPPGFNGLSATKIKALRKI